MKEKWIKVALVQPKLIEDNNKNIERVENLIRKAAEDRPDVVILPERWWFINPFAGEVKEKIQEERGAQYQYAKQWAKELSINIVAGSIWEWRKGFEKPYITSYFFDNNGKEVGRQDKIQLYKAEKMFFNSGKSLHLFKLPLINSNKGETVRFSTLICFDLHIRTELAKMAVENGAEIIFSPTLIIQEGEEHWEAYVKTRALEYRIPIVSVNSIMSYEGRDFLGKSKVFFFENGPSSPVNLLKTEASDIPGQFTQEIELRFPAHLRKRRLRQLTPLKDLKIELH